jgi:HTH-type transcriptional regulator, transcriptional repressor of NAD biosynthesis genes
MQNNNIKNIGLVVGKFAPYHTGHEHLLAYAFASTDQLIVFLYDAPDCTNVPLSVRARWIQKEYPNAIVLEGYNPPPRGTWNEHTQLAHEEFIKNNVSGHPITHVFSSEDYGERLSVILGAAHVRVEKIFGELPLSATALRRDPSLYYRYVQQHVHDDIKKYGDVTH